MKYVKTFVLQFCFNANLINTSDSYECWFVPCRIFSPLSARCKHEYTTKWHCRIFAWRPTGCKCNKYVTLSYLCVFVWCHAKRKKCLSLASREVKVQLNVGFVIFFPRSENKTWHKSATIYLTEAFNMTGLEMLFFPF
jgi:hypothetical protein